MQRPAKRWKKGQSAHLALRNTTVAKVELLGHSLSVVGILAQLCPETNKKEKSNTMSEDELGASKGFWSHWSAFVGTER